MNAIESQSAVKRNRSVERAVNVLRAIADQPGNATPTSIARTVNVPQPTVARLLATLADSGIVERNRDGDGYVIGYELIRICRTGDPHRLMVRRAHPVLEQLAREVAETVTLTVPRPPLGVEVISQVDGGHLIGDTDWVGLDFPLHASATGKLMLAELAEEEVRRHAASANLERCTPNTIVEPGPLVAELERVRTLGYADTVDELEVGFAAIAACSRDDCGRIVAMIGINGPTFRFDPEHRTAALPKLFAAARSISEALASAPAGADRTT
jgi:IclR family transcriptional regulator, acetate operon repressor